MATSSRTLAALARPGVQLTSVNRMATRSFTNISRSSTNSMATRCAARPVAAGATMRLGASGRIAFRRAYADAAPQRKPGKIRKTFRWMWRFTYLSVIGVVGYTCYVIYDDRNPEPQFEQDPTKKTIVVLGKLINTCQETTTLHQLTRYRYWMGLCFAPQEARHRKLQCRCCVPS